MKIFVKMDGEGRPATDEHVLIGEAEVNVRLHFELKMIQFLNLHSA